MENTGGLLEHLQSMETVLIRTVTNYFTGRVAKEQPGGGFVLLEEGAWIGDTGRWAHALQTGELSEVEPYPGSVLVSLGAVVDICVWSHPLPRETR
jgi:hypothetical protein